MSSWRKCINRYQRISWLLVAALLVQILFPLNFHSHHDTAQVAQEHEHAFHSHALTDNQFIQHLADIDTLELKTMPDVIAQQITENGFLFILLVCLLTLFPGVLNRVRRSWRLVRSTFTPLLFYALGPPSRAPPAV